VSAHTPGPWRVEKEGSNVIRDAEGGTVAHAYGIRNDMDARLIAAAPELLGALKEMQVRSHQAHSHGEFPAKTCGLCTRALAAIAKAEGK
jgi:hypothetical protein